MLRKIFITVTVLLLLPVSNSFSQGNSVLPELTGSLVIDNQILTNNFQPENIPSEIKVSMPAEGKKSPFLGGLMSLVIPGSGEIYAGEYLKAGIFVAVEAAVISIALIYDGKGDDKTAEFENYADGNWSVVRYAEWINTHRPNDNTPIEINPNTNLPPWERVSWTDIHLAEDKAGIGFSHHLAPYGDQQYYEMIGKYDQFAGGWNDFTGGPEYHAISPNFSFYSGMRGDANDLYNIASKAVIGIYLNHFLSALDAVWSTVSYNKNLAVNMRINSMQYADGSELIPTLNVKFTF